MNNIRHRTQVGRPGITLAIAVAIAVLVGPARAGGGCDRSVLDLAAAHIDAMLGSVAASTRAVGEAFATQLRDEAPITPEEADTWRRRIRASGDTKGFRTWSEGAPAPAFQADAPGIYSYRPGPLRDADIAQLKTFERLVPLLRAAYRSFNFSWVYLTSADDLMLIYPYVPLDEAVHNAMPTRQVYYTAADFDRRAVGWTAPYLDLVGAGMMITASYPVYEGDRLLGVASRDVTLRQLASGVLARLGLEDGTEAVLMDDKGLAIEASDPALAGEIDKVNNNAGAAVLHLRTPDGLAALGSARAVASGSSRLNRIGEQVLGSLKQRGAAEVRFDDEGRTVLATRIQHTGWVLVLIRSGGLAGTK
ncbi:MAG: cache domain-containing protein [Chromatiaceae bacterium]|nr:cache domain-containing protein [Chromatiaceae bacterium]MCP5315865.1 cache domain-containing protein [Chromatiaceae bacterium]